MTATWWFWEVAIHVVWLGGGEGLWVYNFVACGDQQLWIHRPAIPLPTLMVLGSFFFFFLINSLSLSFFICQVGNKKRTCLLKLW